jgi:hypothetical protein
MIWSPLAVSGRALTDWHGVVFVVVLTLRVASR